MASDTWVVIGGGDKGAIVVREGSGTDSSLKPERLATCSLVKELALQGDRLHYEKLTGSGPASGWVSTRIPQADGATKELMVKASVMWEVVGGADRGGILVREGKDTGSPVVSERLATGTWIRALELDGERLHFQRINGSGPQSGWASVRLQSGKPLLTRLTETAEGTRVVAQLPLHAVGRRPRILAVHSSPGNSHMMRFQTTQLRKALGQDVEFVFIDAPNEWRPREAVLDPDGMVALYAAERSDFEKRIAGNKPFLEWLSFDAGDMQTPTDESAQRSRSHIHDFVWREGPINVVVAISQGSAVVAGFLESLRERGEDAPWQLSVFFSSVPPENHFLAAPPTEQSNHPVVAVLGGDSDPWYLAGKAGLLARYSNLTVLEHGDGHTFPLTEPGASAVYAQLASLIRSACELTSIELRGTG